MRSPLSLSPLDEEHFKRFYLLLRCCIMIFCSVAILIDPFENLMKAIIHFPRKTPQHIKCTDGDSWPWHKKCRQQPGLGGEGVPVLSSEPKTAGILPWCHWAPKHRRGLLLSFVTSPHYSRDPNRHRSHSQGFETKGKNLFRIQYDWEIKCPEQVIWSIYASFFFISKLLGKNKELYKLQTLSLVRPQKYI